MLFFLFYKSTTKASSCPPFRFLLDSRAQARLRSQKHKNSNEVRMSVAKQRPVRARRFANAKASQHRDNLAVFTPVFCLSNELSESLLSCFLYDGHCIFYYKCTAQRLLTQCIVVKLILQKEFRLKLLFSFYNLYKKTT